jgi:hypothetical protein
MQCNCASAPHKLINWPKIGHQINTQHRAPSLNVVLRDRVIALAVSHLIISDLTHTNNISHSQPASPAGSIQRFSNKHTCVHEGVAALCCVVPEVVSCELRLFDNGQGSRPQLVCPAGHSLGLATSKPPRSILNVSIK